MASTADQLFALAQDPNFRSRVIALALEEAAVVYAEDPATPQHPARLAFAKQVLGGNQANIVNVIATSTNLIGGNTTYDFATGRVKTDVTDAAISSQIATLWNLLSGV